MTDHLTDEQLDDNELEYLRDLPSNSVTRQDMERVITAYRAARAERDRYREELKEIHGGMVASVYDDRGGIRRGSMHFDERDLESVEELLRIPREASDE